jgi:hypothetical protein
VVLGSIYFRALRVGVQHIFHRLLYCTMNEPSHDEQRTTTTELQNPTDTIVDADKWACICTCAPKPEGPGSLPCPGNNSQNKKKTKKHPLAANNITLTGTGVGCEFFSMCNFRGPQPSDMQMRRQAQPRSQQPTANSKQQTANSQKQKCTDG